MTDQQISRALAAVPVPIFLARELPSRGTKRLVIHTAERGPSRGLAKRAEAALAAVGVNAACEVVRHRPASLARYRSLETFVRRLGVGELVFDPTESVGRMEALVGFGAKVRSALGAKVEGLLIDPGRRTFFVIVDRALYPRDDRDLLLARAATLRKVTETFAQWRSERQPNFELALRVGFEPPADIKLIPVDRATVFRAFKAKIAARLRHPAIKAAAASLIGLGAAIPAANAQAVSQPNLSVLTRGAWFGGSVSPNSFGGIGIEGTIPLGPNFGFQQDIAVGSNNYSGTGSHLFWRDPMMGLFGGYASFESYQGVQMERYGVEAEVYLNAITLAGAVASQQGDVQHGTFGRFDVTFYATPNFSITGGAKFQPEGTTGHAGLEWQPAYSGLPGMSVFADARFGGSSNDARVMAGLNFHFGAAPRTLIDRDRRDDPIFSLFNMPLQGIAGYTGITAN